MNATNPDIPEGDNNYYRMYVTVVIPGPIHRYEKLYVQSYTDRVLLFNSRLIEAGIYRGKDVLRCRAMHLRWELIYELYLQ